MSNRYLWNKNIPTIEYDYRARNTRLRLEHLERLLVKRDAVEGLQVFRWFFLLVGDIAGSSRGRGRRAGPPSGRRPCHIGIPWQMLADVPPLIARITTPLEPASGAERCKYGRL